jgi:hypothetical protein
MKDKRQNERSADDSYLAVSRRKRKRYLKIAIPVGAAIAIILGVTFGIEAQRSELGNKMVLHAHPRLNVTLDGSPISIPQNIGIDILIKFAIKYPDLPYIIVCGNEVKGHKSGQALLSLHRNGTNNDGRIIGAIGPNPFLTCSQTDIESFRRQTEIYNLIGSKDMRVIKAQLSIFFCQ